MYAFVFAHAGFDVATATDGTQAFARLAERAPAIIALELSLNGALSAYDLCRHVRAQFHTHAVPLIAVTSRASASNVAHATAAGCDVVLTKPCLPETLVGEAKRLLGLRPAAPLALDSRGTLDASSVRAVSRG
jgi:DNA-binding response OmpR family regulator